MSPIRPGLPRRPADLRQFAEATTHSWEFQNATERSTREPDRPQCRGQVRERGQIQGSRKCAGRLPSRDILTRSRTSSTMGVMQIDLAFGKTGITVDLPERFRYRVLEARTAAPLRDWQGALEAAFDRPIGAPGLADLARGKRSAAISVCDITRPAPNRLTLPAVLRRLERGGIPREGITILIATGLHRAATGSEIREICGDEIAAAYRVVNHDARNLSSHRLLGSTQSGTPVYI